MNKMDIYAYTYGLFSVACFTGYMLFISKNQFIAGIFCFVASVVLAVLGARKSTHRVDI